MQRSLLNCSVMSFVMLFAPFAQVPQSSAQTDENLKLLEESFANPPDASRIMMRWWWFGPSVTKPELQRELEQMKAEGIGGVEIATLYPLALEDPKTGFHNQPFLYRTPRCDSLCRVNGQETWLTH